MQELVAIVQDLPVQVVFDEPQDLLEQSVQGLLVRADGRQTVWGDVDCGGQVTVGPGALRSGADLPMPVPPGATLRAAAVEADGALDKSGTVTIEFDPPLPDADCCEVFLDGLASSAGVPALDTHSVRTLAGDTNLDGQVNAVDNSQARLYFGQPVDATNFLKDFNASGVINAIDNSQLRLFFGHTAPACP